MSNSREIELKVGRRAQDGVVRVSTLMPHLVQLSVNYKGERAVSVVLTRQQARQLQQALAQLEPSVDAVGTTETNWDGSERRRSFEREG